MERFSEERNIHAIKVKFELTCISTCFLSRMCKEVFSFWLSLLLIKKIKEMFGRVLCEIKSVKFCTMFPIFNLIQLWKTITHLQENEVNNYLHSKQYKMIVWLYLWLWFYIELIDNLSTYFYYFRSFVAKLRKAAQYRTIHLNGFNKILKICIFLLWIFFQSFM